MTRTGFLFPRALPLAFCAVMIAVCAQEGASQENAADAKVHLIRGNTSMDNLQYDEAIAHFDLAIALDPKYASAYGGRGNAYGKKGDFDKAIADYTKAIALNPKYAPAYVGRGNAYSNKGDFDKAIADYAKALQLRPGNAYWQIRLYLARARTGKDGKADLAKFRKTIKDKKWILFVVRMYLGEITPAQCLAAAAHKNPKTDREQKCEAHYYIGQHLLLKGDKPAAMAHFRKCVATGVTDFIEYMAAKAELRRAGGGK